MNNQNFAELIISARKAAGITQAELAWKIGANRSRISEYERGEKIPYNKKLIAICVALGLDTKAAIDARDMSLKQYREKGKGNKMIKAMAACAHARSCKKARKPASVKEHIGFCHCSGGKFSSAAALIKVCLAQHEKGEKRCQSCKVLKTCGNDKEALRQCNITIMEMKWR